MREVIARRGLLPPRRAARLESWPRPVEVRTLGSFTVFRNGQPVRQSARAHGKPVELLQILVALQTDSAGVAEEAVVDALWPDAEGDAARHALETTVYRVRRLLGNEVVVHRNRRLALDDRRCWVDAWALDQRLTQAIADLDRAGVHPTNPADAEAIASLYRGPFLPGDDRSLWARSMRGRLRERLRTYLDAVAGGATVERSGDRIAFIRAECLRRDSALEVRAPRPARR